MTLLRRKTKVPPPVYDLPLGLRSVDGALLHIFPGEVISSMRHLENTLVYSNQLAKSIALVAALSGEGVTYSSLALGTTLASDLQSRICVVELNWYQPGLCAQLSNRTIPLLRKRGKKAAPVADTSVAFDGGPGLAGVLMGECTLDAALIPTELSNLTLMPAGALAPNLRAAMARSEILQQVLENLSERFDHLILDIPAIHTTSDAIALASLSQSCCIVIRQGVTPVNSVRRALDTLVHLDVIGVILNQVSSEMPRWMHRLVPQE